ncbi:MAG: hypothetical protein KDC23_06265 [Actinobacteria bacterium]|nr:hypothetical protein [Actinomycetota bacterium]
MRLKFLVAMLAAVALLTGCAGGDSAPASSASGSVEVPTASFTPPQDYRTSPSDSIQLNSIQPDDGTAPVVEFINSATQSIDVSIYRIDADFDPVVSALAAAAANGIDVRVSMSRQLIGGENPPEGNAGQVAVVESLRAQGIEAELSRPEFHYGHEKSIIIDAGTPAAKAMIADWNLQQSYFGPSKYGPVGARGFAVVATDPDDVATVAAYFDANWPPFTDWPVNTRASLVWSPSGEGFTPTGNGVEALTDFMTNADRSLDVYAEYIQDDSFLLQTLIDRANDGVVVRVIANSDGQSPAIVDKLRAAGAQVVFDPTNAMAPDAVMFVHSKTMVADYGQPDQVAFVGSQNQFINESLEAILELGTLVTDQGSIEEIQQTFNTDFSRSSQLQAKPSPSPSASGSPSASQSPSASGSPSASQSPSASGSPSASPSPSTS